MPSDPPPPPMQHIIENHPDMATALLAGEKLKELILPGPQDDKTGSLAALLLQLKLELPFDRVVTIGTVLIPILLVTLVFTKNFAGKGRLGNELALPASRTDGRGKMQQAVVRSKDRVQLHPLKFCLPDSSGKW